MNIAQDILIEQSTDDNASKAMFKRNNPIIIPMIKSINNVELILWDYVERVYMFKEFVCMSDEWAEYVPIRFESL
jgi:hypothetical protein